MSYHKHNRSLSRDTRRIRSRPGPVPFDCSSEEQNIHHIIMFIRLINQSLLYICVV